MKKISVLFFVCCLCLLALCGCSSNSMELYLNDSPYTSNQVEIALTAKSPKDWDNTYKLELKFIITNRNSDLSSYYFGDGVIVREKDGAKYSVTDISTSHYIQTKTECDIPTTLYGHATLPSSIEDEKYMFTYSFEGVKFTIHLYDSAI